MIVATAADTNAIGKLLLNAWSAEYALRIKPVTYNRDYLNTALNWVFPQAYFAALFSARALLLTQNVRNADPETIERLVQQWANGKSYATGFTRISTLFADLKQYRSARPQSLTGPEAAILQRTLIEKVNALALLHETYILRRMGSKTYQLLIDELPDYLRTGFVGQRAAKLSSKEKPA